jgi:hypothetical protein
MAHDWDMDLMDHHARLLAIDFQDEMGWFAMLWCRMVQHRRGRVRGILPVHALQLSFCIVLHALIDAVLRRSP